MTKIITAAQMQELDRRTISEAHIPATTLMERAGSTFNADGTGNVLNPLIQWQNGQMELVWPDDQATADFVYPAPPFEERNSQ